MKKSLLILLLLSSGIISAFTQKKDNYASVYVNSGYSLITGSDFKGASPLNLGLEFRIYKNFLIGAAIGTIYYPVNISNYTPHIMQQFYNKTNFTESEVTIRSVDIPDDLKMRANNIGLYLKYELNELFFKLGFGSPYFVTEHPAYVHFYYDSKELGTSTDNHGSKDLSVTLGIGYEYEILKNLDLMLAIDGIIGTTGDISQETVIQFPIVLGIKYDI